MRKKVDVGYAQDSIYKEEIAAWMREREPKLAINEVDEDKDDLNFAYVDYPQERKESLLHKILVVLGRSYPRKPIDWTAERLLDHRGKPWVTVVSLHAFGPPARFQTYWERTLFSLDPDLDRLADDLEENIRKLGCTNRILALSVQEADGRSWVCRQEVSSIVDYHEEVRRMFAVAMSDEAVMVGPFAELWEIRRRAISRLQTSC